MADPGGATQAVAPPIGLEKKISGERNNFIWLWFICLTANLYLFILRIKHNGLQWAVTIHSVVLVLSKIKVLLQIVLGTRPITLYSERTSSRTHTCQYGIILYYHICGAQYSDVTH